MKIILFVVTIFFVSSAVFAQDEAIEWSEIDTLNTVLNDDGNEKHFFIDVYTEWCGWCKKMDATTFSDPEVVELMNKYFIPVKFDAEQKESILFSGTEFKFVENGRRGYNELAAALMQNKMSYPTVVLLNEKAQMIQPLPGYRSAEDLKPILIFIGKEIYKEKSYDEFLKTYEKS